MIKREKYWYFYISSFSLKKDILLTEKLKIEEYLSNSAISYFKLILLRYFAFSNLLEYLKIKRKATYVYICIPKQENNHLHKHVLLQNEIAKQIKVIKIKL